MSPQKHAAQVSNAAASTGPRTQIGKWLSSQNRVTHGLCGQKYKVPVADRPEFDRHHDAMLAELAPAGAVETQLAEAIIVDFWRMAKARQLENEIFTQGIVNAKDEFFAGAETWAARHKELALLSLYAQRIHRVLVRNQADLAALQAARKAAEAANIKPIDAAAPIKTAADSSPGFVRSLAPQSSSPMAQPFSPAHHEPAPQLSTHNPERTNLPNTVQIAA